MNTYVIIRARAFTGDKLRDHRCMVTGSEVRVWDHVARHYTTVHNLSRTAIRRAIAKQ